jgi:hypothetical protein
LAFLPLALAGGAWHHRPMTDASGFSAYTLVRLVHGYWRWPVFLLALVVLGRALAAWRARRPWQRTDERLIVSFLGALDLQLLLGLVLYFAWSPYFRALLDAPRAALADRVTRFFAVEHQTAMLLAVILAHAGRIRARRADSDEARQRIVAITLILCFVLVLWAIPWPWRAVGRPLLRASW